MKIQPPSGGCVLKRHQLRYMDRSSDPAAFRRLCVETLTAVPIIGEGEPAAFRRLCVETECTELCPAQQSQPPSGGCVLKLLPAVSA